MNVCSVDIPNMAIMIFVYVENRTTESYPLWKKLTEIAKEGVAPRICISDFNIILGPEEHLWGACLHIGAMEDFAQALEECSLEETNGLIWKHLDRVCVNREWMDMFDKVQIQHLPRTWSDHCPILISCEASRGWQSPSIRYVNIWHMHDSFRQVVKGCWESPMEGNGIQKF